MDTVGVIAKEFNSSLNRAIKTIAKTYSYPEDKIQIVFELDSADKNIWKMCSDFAFVRLLQFNEIAYISPIYSMFKGKIATYVKDFLIKLAEQNGVPHNTVSVFIVRSKSGPDVIRLMLYIKGQYKQELTVNDIIEINKK